MRPLDVSASVRELGMVKGQKLASGDRPIAFWLYWHCHLSLLKVCNYFSMSSVVVCAEHFLHPSYCGWSSFHSRTVIIFKLTAFEVVPGPKPSSLWTAEVGELFLGVKMCKGILSAALGRQSKLWVETFTTLSPKKRPSHFQQCASWLNVSNCNVWIWHSFHRRE